MKKSLFCLGLAACAAISSTARADDNHYLNMIIGDRASGMGGAYTAVSDDPSGMYYNPAGIVYGVGDEMSASMNAYHRSKTVFPEALGETKWVRQSSALIPNFFGVTRNFGDWAVGFSYAVPDSSVEDQNQQYYNLTGTAVPINRFIINLREEVNVLSVGPSAAYAFNNDLSVGLTLNYYSRKYNRIANQIIYVGDGSGGDVYQQVVNEYLKKEETGIRPVLGVMWSPADRLSLGLRVAQTFVMDADSRYQIFARNINSGDTSVLDTQVTTFGDKRDYPVEIGLGAALFASSQLLLTGDLAFYTETGDTAIDNGKDFTWNAALGGEYYPSRSWCLRAGLFSNRSNMKDNTQDAVINLYGGTLSGTIFSKGTSMTLGGAYSAGKGDYKLYGASGPAVDCDRETMTVFISTSYNY